MGDKKCKDCSKEHENDEMSDMPEDKRQEESKAKPSKEDRTKDEKIADLTNHAQRLQAEFENYKRRVEKEKSDIVSTASKNLILKILHVTDNFERAISSVKEDEKNSFFEGMEMIYAQIMQILSEEGLVTIKTLGEKFSPYLHEALLAQDSDKEPGTIIEELQKGYKLNDTVIRHAKVKVAK